MVRPDGPIVRPAAELAPGRASLAGVRVAVLSNNKPNAPELLGAVADALGSFGAVPGPVHVKNAATPMADQVLDGIEREVTIVLTGAGD
jgi:hypothetical protein